MKILILLTILSPTFAEVLLYLPGEHWPLDSFKDIPSSFGDSISSGGLQAKIVYASPADGCQLIAPPPSYDNTTSAWVALISRNNCSFDLKIRNAQRSNYDGVIVHNTGSNNILEMYVENATGINIPSVFIGEYDGIYLRTIFALQDECYVVITPDYTSNYSYLFLFITGMGAIIFSVITLNWVINTIAHHYRQSGQRQPISTIKQLIIEHNYRNKNQQYVAVRMQNEDDVKR